MDDLELTQEQIQRQLVLTNDRIIKLSEELEKYSEKESDRNLRKAFAIATEITALYDYMKKLLKLSRRRK